MNNKLPIHRLKKYHIHRSDVEEIGRRASSWRKKLSWKKVISYLFILGIASFFCFTLFVAWLTRDLPDPNKLQDRVVAESTKMYDRTGQHLLYEVFDQKKRTIVELTNLPKYIGDATISIEDAHFYEHKGVRWLSLARAIVANILHLSSGQGGASTLTQQLVKNAILTNERSFSRKIKEAVLALQIERLFTKDQILKLYLNEIPYGSTNYGIESAAQSYYRKPAKDLTLAEAATLASMPQAPSRYLQNPKMLKARRDYVLGKMQELKYITAAQLDDAKKQNTDLIVDPNSTIAPHFVMYVKEKLVDQFGEKAVDQGGLKVVTTIDYDLQLAANEAVKNGVDVAEKKYGATNGALLALNPTNGEILAMVGSRDFFDEKNGGQFNVVTQGLRQPGSSFKPIVYTAAFEKGFPPDAVFYDAETNFPYDGKTYTPHNYDGKEHGPVTMRQALQGSLNIPAVKTVFLVGVDKALDFAERLGYTTFKDRSQFGPSIVLGGGGVKMIEHANAYAAFANGGEQNAPQAILKITDHTGKEMDLKKPDAQKVLAPEVAATISNVLSDNGARAFIFGANNYLTLPDRPVAVKTGTTNDYHDAWTVGYVPKLVTAVWVGNNDNKQMKRGADGSVVAAPIWQSFMKTATQKMPVEGFPYAPGNTATKPILRGLLGGGITVSIDSVSGKLATADTPAEMIEKRTYVPPHDILYYVNPDEPLGDSNGQSSAQYLAWEAGVERWMEKQKGTNNAIIFGEPPTESDDIHKKELRPVLSILFPQTGGVISGPEFTTQIDVSAPRGIKKVEYYLDGVLVNTATQFPFSFTQSTTGFKKGNHSLKVIAHDDVSNTTVGEVSFQFVEVN